MAEAKRLETVIGENIRRYRGDLWSQAELGEEIGNLLGAPWSRSTVSQAESGKRAFVAAEMVALARVFGVTIADLYRRYDVGNVIISDIFVMSRTELLSQTMAMEPSEVTSLVWKAVETLDRAQASIRESAANVAAAEREQQLAIDLLSHVGRNKVVGGTDAQA